MLPVSERIGDRWKVAVEFEIRSDKPRKWNEVVGSLWLWLNGNVVGRTSEREMVLIGLESLQEAALEDRSLGSQLLAGRNAKEALETVMWARYGDDDQRPAGVSAASEDILTALEVLPRRAGPFFDGWEAILVNRNETERFIYRKEREEVAEVALPVGSFGTVVSEAKNRFERIARAMFEHGEL